MQLINDILYISYTDFIEAGWNPDTVRKANLRKGPNWEMHPEPPSKKNPLVKYETLTDEHKAKLAAVFGNLYERVARGPILAMLERNGDAERFYLAYTYGSGAKLPVKRVRQYTRAAEWLTMLNKVSESIGVVKKTLGINMPTFYKHVANMIELEKQRGKLPAYEGTEQMPADFPTSYARLTQKQAAFKAGGYDVLVDKMYGNALAKKVNDDVAEAQLLTYIEDPRQWDDVMVAMMYNIWANQNGYKLITPATVGVWRRKCDVQVSIGRYGNSAFNERHIRQVKGSRPSAPLYLVEHDDNNFDLLFNSDDYQYNKYVGIVVIDSCCGLVLGKSYRMAQSPVAEMVHHAYLDAMYYIRSLTGGWYLPLEVKGDRWASSALTPFYQKIGKHVPPATGNKHRGYIEQFFGSPLWKRSQKLVSDGNYTGNNMTAKNRGINPDMLDQRVRLKLGPSVGSEAETMIENMFTLCRHLPDFTREKMDAKSKEQQWLERWAALPESQKRPITDEQFLMIFGIKHAPQGRSIMITNRGVEPQINGVQYSYDLPDAAMYNSLIGEDVNVYYDPFDMSRVLVTDGKGIRFIAKSATLTPRALEDSYTGSRVFLNALLAEKKGQVQTASEGMQRRSGIASPNFNAEAMLQGGVMVKELKNKAEAVVSAGFLQEREQFLDDQLTDDYFQ